MDTPAYSVVIVGAGFAGLGMAIALQKAGVDDFIVLEQASEVGGTWRDNRYPGATCDVESHLYSFAFDPNPLWSRTFASQPEIFAYLVACAKKFGIRHRIRFGAAIVKAVFDEQMGIWSIGTAAGETIRARVVISACGALSRPAVPRLTGIEAFAGKTFHSSSWEAGISLAGKNVAVIGTGASAIQIVPSIAPQVARLYVCQRTAPWVMPKPDRAFTPTEHKVLRRAPVAQKLLRSIIYWQREALALGFVIEPRIMKVAERLSRRHLERSIEDPTLRAKLTPNYRMGCKRILPSNDYYSSFLRTNVELVTEELDHVTKTGIVTSDGLHRPLDVIVLATGFQAADNLSPFDIVGKAERSLAAEWSDGAQAFLGTTVSGYPNLFFIIGPNTGVGHGSMVFMIESQIAYIRGAIQTMKSREIERVEVREDAQRTYNERIQARMRKTIWATGCRSWYLTRTGKNTALWPGFTFEFRLRTRRFDPRHYHLSWKVEDKAPHPDGASAPSLPME